MMFVYGAPYLDHADIVGTITNSQCHGSQTIFDKLNDKGFLQRRDSAAHNAFALSGKPEQKMLILCLTQCLVNKFRNIPPPDLT